MARHAARALGVDAQEILSVRIVKKSVDARDKGDVHFSFTLDVEARRAIHPLPRGASLFEMPPRSDSSARRAPLAARPLVVGLGPAGLFAALTLA